MAGPIELKFNDEALEQIRVFDSREKMTEQYILNRKKIKGTWKEKNEQLSALRKEYIRNYLEVSPSVIDLNLVSFVNSLFYEFDRTKFVVKDVLRAREEVWKEILDVYAAGKINNKSLENLIAFIGVDKEFYDKNFLVGDVGSAYVGNLSLFDSKIVNRRMKHRALGLNLSAIKDKFYEEGAFHSQIEKIYDRKVRECFDSEDCKQYLFDIMKNASEFSGGDGTLATAIQKNLTKLEQIELSSGSKRIYLDLTYETEEMRWERKSQSISDYRKRGAQYSRAYETETHEYNPDYVSKNLPEGVELKMDDNGYYLVQKEGKIASEEINKIALKYEPKELENS